MKFNLAIKFISIAIIVFGLLFLLQIIGYQVDDRVRYRNVAKHAIANGWAGEQLVVTPTLKLTLSKNYIQSVFDENLKKYVDKQRTRTWTELYIPKQLDLSSKITMQERYKGIYQIPVYESQLTIQGQFESLENINGTIKSVELISSFSDMRGISKSPQLKWNNRNINFKSGKDNHLLGNYISAHISKFDPSSFSKFKMQVTLRGMDAIKFVPNAKQFSVSMSSNWQHPYFIGRYLPNTRTINQQGFDATWQLSEFATSIQQAIYTCQQTPSSCASELTHNAFGVGLHNPC